jgi:hypothetical protein
MSPELDALSRAWKLAQWTAIQADRGVRDGTTSAADWFSARLRAAEAWREYAKALAMQRHHHG